jgi:hypothetical protein
MAGATALLSLAGATLPRALGATTGGIGPSAPGGFKATDGTWNHGIKVVWKAVFDGNYYQLYRSLTPNFAQATTRLRTSSNVLKDFRTTPGLAYYYWINAVAVREVDGKHVDFSSEIVGPVKGVRGISPRFSTQPPSQVTVYSGQVLTIASVPTGYPPVKCLWYKNFSPMKNTDTPGHKISGAHTSTLVIDTAFGGDTGLYALHLANATGQNVSHRVNVLVVH